MKKRVAPGAHPRCADRFAGFSLVIKKPSILLRSDRGGAARSSIRVSVTPRATCLSARTGAARKIFFVLAQAFLVICEL